MGYLKDKQVDLSGIFEGKKLKKTKQKTFKKKTKNLSGMFNR